MKFPCIYGTWRSITMFKREYHSIYKASFIQFLPTYPFCLRSFQYWIASQIEKVNNPAGIWTRYRIWFPHKLAVSLSGLVFFGENYSNDDLVLVECDVLSLGSRFTESSATLLWEPQTPQVLWWFLKCELNHISITTTKLLLLQLLTVLFLNLRTVIWWL